MMAGVAHQEYRQKEPKRGIAYAEIERAGADRDRSQRPRRLAATGAGPPVVFFFAIHLFAVGRRPSVEVEFSEW